MTAAPIPPMITRRDAISLGISSLSSDAAAAVEVVRAAALYFFSRMLLPEQHLDRLRQVLEMSFERRRDRVEPMRRAQKVLKIFPGLMSSMRSGTMRSPLLTARSTSR